MNRHSNQLARFVPFVLSGLVVVASCTQADSVGRGDREDGARADGATADGPATGGTAGTGGATSGQGGAVGQGGGGAIGGGGQAGGTTDSGGTSGLGGGGAAGGSVGTGGVADGGGGTAGAVSCAAGPATGQRCTSLPAGKVCRLGDSCLAGCAPDCSCRDGVWSCERVCRDCNLGSNPGTGAPPASGPLVCSVFCDYQTPQLDASANAVDGGDAPAGDADPDAVACSTPNPAEVTCLSSKGQCVPSTCGCSGAMGWVCTADCRSTTLPLCDGGTGADGKQDGAGEPDADLDAVTVDAPVLGNYTCRDDSDCCIVVDTCMEVAYLYSKAPGATAPPTFPPRTTCVPCIPPAVQVRCDQGQCVGQKLSTGIDYGSSLRSDHCGPIDLPDAAASIFQPAYAGAQQTSWGC